MPLPQPVYEFSTPGTIPAGIAALEVSWSNQLQRYYAAAEPQWQKFCSLAEINAGGKMVLFAVDRTQRLQPDQGGATVSPIIMREVDIEGDPVKLITGINEYKFKDDMTTLKVLTGLFEVLGDSIAIYPDELVANLILGGTSYPWWNGSFFFDDEIPVNPEFPTRYGTQSNNIVSTPLTYENYRIGLATMANLRATNGTKAGMRATHLITGETLYELARRLVQADVLPTSIQNPDSTYGVAATSNTLKGSTEPVPLTELDIGTPLFAGDETAWILANRKVAAVAPFAVAQREAIRIIPRLADTDPKVSEENLYTWTLKGRISGAYAAQLAAVRFTAEGS